MAASFSPTALRVLRAGNILPDDQTPDDMVNRVLDAVFDAELAAGTPPPVVAALRAEFADAVDRKLVGLGTPMLTNASRPQGRALGSCVAVPVDPRRPLAAIAASIEAYYQQNMGSGFDLDPVDDPVAVVVALNDHAERLTIAEACERYIGNLANIGVDHPRVRDFVAMKTTHTDLGHFNVSVDVTEQFMVALATGDRFRLRDGTWLWAAELWDEIVQAAWCCGDPGLVFLERFNADNPTPTAGAYVTTAPCAEVALAPGESCVFGYLNLARFATRQQVRPVDHELLGRVTMLLTRVLDNALEASLDHYPAPASRWIMRAKRKIGIGVCGFADLLVRLAIPYDSAAATALLEELLAWISFVSKRASVELARQRGSFGAFSESRYALDPQFLSGKYGGIDAAMVSLADWQRLERAIRSSGWLRNASTTALPPSGRTALLLDASTSIEPWFSPLDASGQPRAELVTLVSEQAGAGQGAGELLARITQRGTCQVPGVPRAVSEVVKCAAEISPLAHLRVVAAATRCVDEAASKTINLPHGAAPAVVGDVFLTAWQSGLKAISVYRDGTVVGQPEPLGGGLPSDKGATCAPQ